MTEYAGPEVPIRDVTTGMTVVDADGESVGTVDEVRMADAGAEAGTDQTADSDNAVGWLAGIFGSGSGLSEQTQERLARLGYLRVEGTGLFSGDRYVEADQIATVSGDEVRLSVSGDQLLS